MLDLDGTNYLQSNKVGREPPGSEAPRGIMRELKELNLEVSSS